MNTSFPTLSSRQLAVSRTGRRKPALLCALGALVLSAWPLLTPLGAADSTAPVVNSATAQPEPGTPTHAEPAGDPPAGGGAEPADPDPSHAALYVEQSYTYASLENGGQKSRDVVQKIYMTREKIAIHDTAESVIIDFKNRTVTTLHHDKKDFRTETFDHIKKRIDDRIALQRRNLDAMTPGPQKEQVYQTVRGFLDDEVTYSADVKEMVEKSAGGAFLDQVTITAARTHNGNTTTETALSAKLSRELQLPFKNFNYAEVLYYLELAGEKMTKELKGVRAGLLPMELKLILPTGGTVESKVVKFEYKTGFDTAFFLPPEGYVDADKQADPTVPRPPPIDWNQIEE